MEHDFRSHPTGNQYSQKIVSNKMQVMDQQNGRNHQLGNMKKNVEKYQFWTSNIISQNKISKVLSGIEKGTKVSVAIKAIPLQKIKSNPIYFARLQNEIKLCRNLSKHKHIAQYLDVYSTVNNYYIMMQQYEGDLKRYLKKKGRLTEQQLLPIFTEILQGLKHIYTNGYIHCGIKPSNILLGRQGVKITDFEMCKRRNTDNNQKTDFSNEQWNSYINPLSLVSKIFIDNSDVWAFGVLIYECLHGHGYHPWIYKDYHNLLQNIQEKNIKFSPHISIEMKQFLLRCFDLNQNSNVLTLFEDSFVQQQFQIRKTMKIRRQQLPNFDRKFSQKVREKVFTPPPKQISRKITQTQKDHQFQPILYENNHKPRNQVKQLIQCQISWMRFLSIILKQDERAFLSKPNTIDPRFNQIQERKHFQHSYMRFILIKQTLSQKQSLKQMLNTHSSSNPFHIEDLQKFVQNISNQSTIRYFRNTLQQYDGKYSSLKQQMLILIPQLTKKMQESRHTKSPEWRSLDILHDDFQRKQILSILGVRISKDYSKQLWRQIQLQLDMLNDSKTNKKDIIKDIEEKTLRLDFLISYHVLNCLLLDCFSNPIEFMKQSQLNVIMGNKPLKLELENIKFIKEKLKKLEFI